MSTRRRRREQPDRLPPLLMCLIEAAKHEPNESVDRTGHAAALADLGRWALVRVPTEGVLAPDDAPAFMAIQEIATRHLRLDVARAELREALSAVEPFQARDSIESACHHLQSVYDEVYYYAGLACGITVTSLDAPRW